MASQDSAGSSENARTVPTIGVVTALTKEKAAFEKQLEDCEPFYGPQASNRTRYDVGYIKSADGGRHCVVLALLPDMGNNMAAACATALLRDIPSLTSIIMVGIAGGAPHPTKPDEHIRLGDIVVSNRGGVVQYDLGKDENGVFIERHAPRPPSPILLSAVRHLEAKELAGEKPWLPFIENTLRELQWQQPPASKDTLADSDDPTRIVKHPRDTKRIKNQPRVFFGPIAASNTLLKNAKRRDQLRDTFGVKAVEMEGSGVADACWLGERGYLVVRGICDYCDMPKGDNWQYYAATVAAGYTRALIESMPAAYEQPVEKRVSAVLVTDTPTTKETQIVHAVFDILRVCPAPFPVEVIAKSLHCTQTDLEGILADEISAGKIVVTGENWRQQSDSAAPCAHISDFAADALAKLLDYIRHNRELPKGYSQIDNAVALTNYCKVAAPEVVARCFATLDKLLKSRGNKRLVLDVASLSIDAARSVRPQTEDIAKAEAIALLCGKAWVYQRIGQLSEARQCATKSLELGNKFGWTRNTAFCKKCTGRLLRLEAGQAKDAEERDELLKASVASLTDAINLFDSLDDDDKDSEKGDCYSLLGRTRLVMGQIMQAHDAVRQASRFLDDNTNKDFLDLKILQGDLFRQEGNFVAAEPFYNSVIDQHYGDDYEKTDMRARAFFERGIMRKRQALKNLALKDFNQAQIIWSGLDDSRATARAECQIYEIEGKIPQDIIQELKTEKPLDRATAYNLYLEKVGTTAEGRLSQRVNSIRPDINRLKQEARRRAALEYPEWP